MCAGERVCVPTYDIWARKISNDRVPARRFLGQGLTLEFLHTHNYLASSLRLEPLSKSTRKASRQSLGMLVLLRGAVIGGDFGLRWVDRFHRPQLAFPRRSSVVSERVRRCGSLTELLSLADLENTQLLELLFADIAESRQ
jgi:hypothetical protein